MSKNIRKSLHDYLSKIKTPFSQIHLPSKKWIFRGCKHCRTFSFSLDDKGNKAHRSSNNNNNKKNNNEATLDDIDRFLFENFRSLYLRDDEDFDNNNNTHKIHSNNKIVSNEETHGKDRIPSPTSFDSFKEKSLDLCGSRRLFVTRGLLGSMLETTTTTTHAGSSSSSSKTAQNDDDPCTKKKTTTFPDKFVAVLACSKSPYEEFKRSMEGVVEARLRNNEKLDWDFMEELLFNYMNMNEKKSHKFILAAYVDVISLMRCRLQPALKKPQSVRTVKIGKELRNKTKEVTLGFE